MTCPQLLERHDAVAVINTAIAQAKRGCPAVVFVVGEAGMGKTSLLQHAVSTADGMRVAQAQGEAIEVTLPFGYLAQVLRDVSIEPLIGASSLPPPERAVAAWKWLQGWIAATVIRPQLLALDDLHWADPDSLSLLRTLVLHAPSRGLAIVATLRPWPQAAADAAAEAAAAGVATVVHLEPLSDAAARVLVAQVRGGSPGSEPAVARSVRERCGGNPLLLRQLATLPVDAETFPSRTNKPALLLGRFTGLDSAGLEYARTAAVCGAAFRPDVAAEMASLDDRQSRSALAALCGGGLVRGAGPGFAAFNHALLRQAIYDDIPEPVRVQLHAKALRILWRRGMPSGECAAHAAAAHLIGDPAAIVVVERAASDATRGGAPEAASRWLGVAVELAGDRAAPGLRLRLAEALHAAGSPRESRAACRELLDEARLPEHLAAAAHRLMARARYELGEIADAEWGFEHAATLAAGYDPQLAIEALLEASLLSLYSSGPARSWYFAKQAQSLVDGGTDRQIAAWVGVAAGHARSLMADPAGVDEVQRALEFLPTGSGLRGLHGSAAWGPRLVELQTAKFTEHFDDALTRFDRACSESEAAGVPLAMSIYAVAHADTLTRTGRLEEARKILHEALDDAPWLAARAPWATVGLAYVSYEQDQPELAAQYCDQIDEVVGAEGDSLPLLRFWLFRVRATLALDHGRADEAATLVDRARAVAERSGTREPSALPWYSIAVRAYLAVGRPAEARAVVEELEELSVRLGRRWSQVVVARGHALLADRSGDSEGAADHFATALRVHEALAMPLEHVETLVAYGSWLRRQRQPRKARLPLGEAARLASEHGARRLERLATTELRAAGGRRRSSAGNGTDVLTDVQARVAALATDGLTNAEIGRCLYISPRTVEHHLSRVYAILGIGSRRQLLTGGFFSDRAVSERSPLGCPQ